VTWVLFWKVVVAAAALVMIVNAIVLAHGAARDAIREWTAPRGSPTGK
jgi:hypothetical protein